MSKRTRPWTRRQRKAIRRRTMPRLTTLAGWHLGQPLHLAESIFGNGAPEELERLEKIAREVGGSFALVESSDDLNLFTVRRP